MGGLDRFNLIEELKSKGWAEDVQDDGKSMMRPPRQLLAQLAEKRFHVYDARDLQDIAEHTSL